MKAASLKAINLTNERAQAAGNRSRIYAYLSGALDIPEKGFYKALKGPEFAAGLTAIISGLPYEFKATLLPELPETPFEEFQSEFIAMFDVGVKGPVCPLNEGAHRKSASRKSIMEELIRFYNHFGLRLPERIKELPDHLVTELEFMHYLCFLEADAAQHDNPLRPFILAQRDFLKRHLNLWVPGLVQALSGREACRFHYELLKSLAGFIEADLEYLEEQVSKEG